MANLTEVMTPEEIDKYGHLIMPVDTNITIDSVILSPENRKKIEQFKTEMQNAEKLKQFGLDPMNRLLLYGDSGCGKTYLTKALSNYLDYYMIYVDIAKALSDGSVSQSISTIFMLAEKYRRCIVFFDECDSIAWNRDAASGEGGVARRATNSIFQSLDQMNPTNVFVAATNMLHRLDPAFETRFNLKLEFRRPKTSILETVKKFVNPKFFEIVIDVTDDTSEVMMRKCTLSYRELTSICNRAMKNAVIDNTFKVKLSDVYEAIAEVNRFKIEIAKTAGDRDPENAAEDAKREKAGLT